MNRTSFFSLCAFVTATLSADAASIAVANHSFEDTALTAGGWFNGVAPGWSTASPDTDTFVEYITGFVSDGVNHHGMAANASLWQELSTPWAANTAYTLIVGVGNRNETWSQPGNASTIYLEATSSPVGTSLASNVLDASTLTASTFSDLTLTFVTGAVAPSGNIRVRVSAEGVGRSHFDNVRLTADPIPEPSIASLSLLGLALTRRRRK